ncbi:hypothetical protein ACNKHL_11750 [Shigella flexneri]
MSCPGARAYAKNISAEGLAKRQAVAGFGPALLGRVLDGSGKPLDGLPLPDRRKPCADYPAINPLQRTRLNMLDTSVRPINALLTVGRGQRLGLPGSGVGKSVLLGMMPVTPAPMSLSWV